MAVRGHTGTFDRRAVPIAERDQPDSYVLVYNVAAWLSP